MNKLRYIRYSRKSSEAKERQALSIIEQNIECDKYALKEGLKVITKIDESKSAYKPRNRPEFDKMLALIESNQADAILAWHPNRLSRNPEEGGRLLQLLQDGAIKEIRTSSGDIYTPESDQLVLQINFGAANQYSRDISRNVKRSLKHKAERGEYPRAAIVGYDSQGEKGRKNLIPNSFEAPIVLEVFQMASTAKYSLGYLVDYVHKKGLRTKRDKKISKSHLYSILTNPVYYGYFYQNGELYKGVYESIVAKQLFEAVQKALKDRSKPKVNSWSSQYNGLIKCPSCGCAYTTSCKVKNYKRTGRTVTYIYLHCTRRKGACTQPPITLEKFEEQLIEKISQIGIDEEVWKLGIDLLKEKHNYEAERNMSQLSGFQTQYNKIQDKLNRLIEMRADEELTRSEFMIQKELLLGEQARIKGLIDDREVSLNDWLELAESFVNTAFHARNIINSGTNQEKRDLIIAVGENLFIDDKRLEFSFKKPFDILLKPEYRTNGQARQDSNLE